MDDEDRMLVRECLEGVSSSFEALLDRYQTTVFNIALRMTRDYEDAQDITQSTFVKAYEKLSTYKPTYRFFSWLYRIAMNETLNTIRRRRAVRHLDDGDLASRGSGPERAYEISRLNERIGASLMELTPDYRIAIILRHFLHMSMREISRLLDVPERTVKSRLFSARRRLGILLLDPGRAS
jgi:RNA polymerase sigma-70 factor (ECF subfamily)